MKQGAFEGYARVLMSNVSCQVGYWRTLYPEALAPPKSIKPIKK